MDDITPSYEEQLASLKKIISTLPAVKTGVPAKSINRDDIKDFFVNFEKYPESKKHYMFNDRYEPILRNDILLIGRLLEFDNFNAWDIIKQSMIAQKIKWQYSSYEDRNFHPAIWDISLKYNNSLDIDYIRFLHDDISRRIEMSIIDNFEKAFLSELDRKCVEYPQSQIHPTDIRVLDTRKWFFLMHPKSEFYLMDNYHQYFEIEFGSRIEKFNGIEFISNYNVPEDIMYLVNIESLRFIPDELCSYVYNSSSDKKKKNESIDDPDSFDNYLSILINLWCRFEYNDAVVHQKERERSVAPVIKFKF